MYVCMFILQGGLLEGKQSAGEGSRGKPSKGNQPEDSTRAERSRTGNGSRRSVLHAHSGIDRLVNRDWTVTALQSIFITIAPGEAGTILAT